MRESLRCGDDVESSSLAAMAGGVGVEVIVETPFAGTSDVPVVQSRGTSVVGKAGHIQTTVRFIGIYITSVPFLPALSNGDQTLSLDLQRVLETRHV